MPSKWSDDVLGRTLSSDESDSDSSNDSDVLDLDEVDGGDDRLSEYSRALRAHANGYCPALPLKNFKPSPEVEQIHRGIVSQNMPIAVKLWLFQAYSFVLLCEVLPIAFRWQEPGLIEKVLGTSPDLILLFMCTPFVVLCLLKPKRRVYNITVLVYTVFDWLSVFVPPYSSRFLETFTPVDLWCIYAVQTLTSPLLLPDHRLTHVYLWLPVVIFYVAALFVPGEDVHTDSVDVLVSLFLIIITNIIATFMRMRIERVQMDKFQLDVAYASASRQMLLAVRVMVPPFVLTRMLANPGARIAHRRPRVSILFVVITEFDHIASSMSTAKLLFFLNEVFTQLDDLCDTHDVTKIETVGEEYVCAVGVSPEDHDQDDRSGHSSILAKLLRVAKDASSLHIKPLGWSNEVKLQMGIHTGPVVAGVVGKKLPRFRLFGDTVNTAARMMQKSVPGEVQFGTETFSELPRGVVAQPRGMIDMKGKGQVMTYFLCHSEAAPQLVRSTSSASAGVSYALVKTLQDLSTLKDPEKVVVSTWDDVGSPFADLTDFVTKVHTEKSHSNPSTPSGRTPSWLLRSLYPAKSVRCTRDERHAFEAWFYEEHRKKAFFKSWQWYLALFLSAGIVELAYVHGCLTRTELSRFVLFVASRGACLVVLIVWRHIARYRTSIANRYGLLVSHSVFTALMFLSYDIVDGCEEPIPVDDSKFAFQGVSTHLMYGLKFPAYLLCTQAQHYLLAPSCMYILLTISLIASARLSFAELASTQASWFLLALLSTFYLYRAYITNISLRGQYKARKELDETLAGIRGILSSLMPPMVVDTLCHDSNGWVFASHQYVCATIAQSDLCGFTEIAATLEPAQVVELICELFDLFDELTDTFQIHKVETVGDAYIAGQAGPPLTVKNSPLSVIMFALGMVRATSQWSRDTGRHLSCRVGVHSGACIGGIVGRSMQRYHLFGRMMTDLEILESTSPEGKVHISQACHQAYLSEVQGSDVLVPQGANINFHERVEVVLLTSKGETHQYDEVGGKTFLASERAPSID